MKIVLAVAAIVAMSTAGFASQRGYDLRDFEYWTANGISNAVGVSSESSTSSAALAVDKGAGDTTSAVHSQIKMKMGGIVLIGAGTKNSRDIATSGRPQTAAQRGP